MKGELLKQIVYATAGFRNQCSYVTITATTGGANTVITDVGLLWITTPASVSVQLQDPANTWTDIIAASVTQPVLIPSDGMNLRIHSADTSTNRTVNYYVIQ
jgi:hypothetical protein